MYKFYVNDKLLHDFNIKELKILEPKIELEQNKIGTFEFVIYPTNPNIDEIKKLASMIYVYQKDDLIFRGRPIETEKGMKNSLKVYCECQRAFLCDSIQQPYEYQGSVEGLLGMFISRHNEQVDTVRQFKLGTVTVTDPNDYITRSDSQWLNTWESIQEKLIDVLGGYINIRNEKDGNYIDYLADFTSLNTQKITFGENLLKVNRKEDCRDIATVLIPLGAKDETTGNRLTIESVNDGKIYLENATGISMYKRITKKATWDDVTIASNLKAKGEKELEKMLYLIQSIEINAVDMAHVGKDISSFKMNAKIHVVSDFHNIDEMFVPMKMSIYPFKASSNKITLNGSKQSLTESSNKSETKYGNIVESVEKIVKDNQLNMPIQIQEQLESLRQELTTIIEQTSSSIKQEVSESYYAIGENDILQQMSTLLEQTKNSFEFTFSEFSQNLQDVINNTNAEFEKQVRYIRLENGNIYLGEIENEFSFIITKEGIEMYQGENKIAYLSNRKLYITFAEVLNSIQIGNFAFVPRSNGNLSIKKVV